MAGNPGSGVFLARIEREGRVPELMLPPPLEALFLGGWGWVAAAVYSRENAASYTSLDRVKATKPEPAETWVKGID